MKFSQSKLDNKMPNHFKQSPSVVIVRKNWTNNTVPAILGKAFLDKLILGKGDNK